MSEGRKQTMKKSLVYLTLVCLLAGLLSLVACKKEEPQIEETTPAAAPATTEPMATDMGTTPMGTDLGTTGTDMTPPPK
jgi:uncharacterized lipoprotein YajG